MSYHYDRSLLSILPNSSLFKLRSRRDVVDWLNSIVSDLSPQSSQPVSGSSDSKDTCKVDLEAVTDVHSRKLSHNTTEFGWLGSPWTCRKRRQHYKSFSRNGAKISVHDFIYVLAEEDKRLVAYLDDMYEDSKGNRQFDNDDIKPFDISQIKGYWRQELLKYMYSTFPSTDSVKSRPFEDGLKMDRNLSDGVKTRPKKRLRQSSGSDLCLQPTNKQESSSPCLNIHDLDDSLVGSKGGTDVCSQKTACFSTCGTVKEFVMQKLPQHLTIGSHVEVLSQDSGLRGCWFRALVIKKHKDKVKVQYRDIKDAADESNNLEEWVLASKVAVSDPLGLRMYGRTTIRPIPPSNKGEVSVVVNAGTVVDVWWHDGWWEGIVLQKETEDKIRVYFPGEKQESVFGSSDLRHSQEWLGNGWKHIKGRPDLVTSILPEPEMNQIMVKSCEVEPVKTVVCEKRQLVSDVHKNSLSVKDEVGCSKSRMSSVVGKVVKELEVVRDLSKDSLLTQLKWQSSKKRRRGNVVQKPHWVGDKSRSPEAFGTRSFDSFFIPKSLKIDHDNCKYIMEPFGSSVVSPLTSLVMSR